MARCCQIGKMVASQGGDQPPSQECKQCSPHAFRVQEIKIAVSTFFQGWNVGWKDYAVQVLMQ